MVMTQEQKERFYDDAYRLISENLKIQYGSTRHDYLKKVIRAFINGDYFPTDEHTLIYQEEHRHTVSNWALNYDVTFHNSKTGVKFKQVFQNIQTLKIVLMMMMLMDQLMFDIIITSNYETQAERCNFTEIFKLNKAYGKFLFIRETDHVMSLTNKERDIRYKLFDDEKYELI